MEQLGYGVYTYPADREKTYCQRHYRIELFYIHEVASTSKHTQEPLQTDVLNVANL